MIENLFTFVRTLGNQRIEGKKFFTTQIGVLGTLSDGTGTVGTAGKVLSSTGSGVEWITIGGGTSNVADLDDLTDVIITTASTGQLLRFNGTSWVNWTPNFLTAYGSLNDLSDAVITTPSSGQLLRYNGTSWVNWTHNFLTTSANLNDLANVSVAGPTNGQILRYNAGTSTWIADDETEPPIPTLDEVTDAGSTTTNGITAGSFTTTGAISGGNITGTKVTTPTVEFNGAVSTNSVEQAEQGEPNPNVFYAKWNGDVQFTVNGDGYAVARTGYKVTGATGGFLKANGTIDTNTYLTSYTETQTLDAVTDLGNTTANAITVGGLISTSVTTPLIESGGLLIIDADTSGSLQPNQGDPAVPVLSFDWQGSTQGYIDTDGKITFNGFKTPSGTSSGFLKADGSIDTNTYLTSVAPYALDDLTDVNASNPQDGEFLKFDDTTGEWINASIPVPTLDSVTDAGNTTTNTIDVGGITTPYVQFEEVEEAHGIARSINWSEDHNALEVFYADEKHFDVGQDQMWYVKNGAEETLLKGTVVMAIGAVGNSGKIEVAPLVADGTVSGRYAIGILMDDVRSGEFGFAMTQGKLRGIDTGEFNEGDTLYPSSDIPGALVNVEPASPALKLPIAFVVTAANNGAIAVRMTQGLDLHEVHDVQITDAANGQLLRLESGIWTNWTPTYITTETDPVFAASAAGSITTTNVSNWNSAYGWGDHALAGYLTTYENNYISDVRISEFIVTFTGEGNAFNGDVDFSVLPFASVTHNHVIAEITGLETALAGKQPVGNYITTETDPTVPDHVKAITEGEIVNWNKAYDWGNHADAGYITSFSETDTLATVTSRGASTSTSVTFSGGFNATGTQDKISSITFHRLHPGSGSPLSIDSLDSFILSKTDGSYGGGTKPTGSHNGFGVISLQTHSGNYFTQLGLDTNQNDLWIRSANDTTSFGSWVRLSTRDWVTSQGYLTTYENNYISDVRLSETTLSFTGTGNAFTGDIDLSTLPFAAASHTHIIGDVTGLQTALDGKVPTTRTLTINGTAFDLSANRSWTIDSADGYISNVRLVETTLTFEGEGNAFAGDVDLSTLPFAPQGSYLTAEADTLATVTGRGNTTSNTIQVGGINVFKNATGGIINTFENYTGYVLNRIYADYNNDSVIVEYQERIGVDGNYSRIGNYSSHPLHLMTNNSNVATITGGGNFGIGTDNPSYKLDVSGNSRVTGIHYVNTYLVTPIIYGGGPITMGNEVIISNTEDGKLTLRVPSGDSSDWNYINFTGANGVRDAYIGTNNVGTPTWWRDDNGVNITLGSSVLINGNTAWHAGNDGSGSGLDADLLDGNHASAFALSGHTHIISTINETDVPPAGVSIQSGPGGGNAQGWAYPYGTRLSAIVSGGRSFEIMSTTYPNGELAMRTLDGSNIWDEWKIMLDANNYSSYAATRTGGNTSGTWPISITGNADTVDGLHASVFVRNDIYNSAGAGLQVVRNIGTIDGSWPDSDHTLSLENSDAGNIVVNFHRAGYTSNNLWYNGSKFRFDQALESTGVITASGGNSTNWNTAYGWGNHADASYIKADSTEPLTIQAEEVIFTGSVTVEGTFTESSSIRFKENITPLEPALDKVNQLEAVSYNKIGVDDREIGLIAEDVAELFPEVVTYNEEGQTQGLNYSRLSVILLKAVQELTERVNKLENK